MADSLSEVKDRVKRLFLGRAGVHGVGISRSRNAIRVYVNPDETAETESLLDLLRAEASPYSLIVVREEPAHLA
jgi:hypothetical protein